MHKIVLLAVSLLFLTGCAKIINELDGHATEMRHYAITCGVGCTACSSYRVYVNRFEKHPTREELDEYIWQEYEPHKGRRKQFEEEFFEAVTSCQENIKNGLGVPGKTLDEIYPYDGYFEGRIPYREDLR